MVGKQYFKPEICELNRASAGIEYDTHWQLKARSSTQLHSLDMKTSVRRSTLVASRPSVFSQMSQGGIGFWRNTGRYTLENHSTSR